MGLMNWLFGAENPRRIRKLPRPSIQQPTARPNHPGLRMELLQELGRFEARIDESMRARWDARLGPLEANIANFLEQGLLAECDIEEKLDRTFSVSQLKPMLRERGVSMSGKKEVLLAKLMAAWGPDECFRRVEHVRCYRLTPAGEAAVAGYRAEEELARAEEKRVRAAMESEALAHLLRGDVRAAGAVIAKYECSRPQPRGIGISWSAGYPEGRSVSDLAVAKAVLNDFHDGLPYDAEIRRRVAAQIVLSELLGDHSSAGQRLVAAAGGVFSCPQLENWLRTEPLGEFTPEVAQSPVAVASIYARTKVSEVRKGLMLEHMLADRTVRQEFKGIRIEPVGDSDTCGLCSGGKLVYPWSETGQIPVLPRHWGCRCTYMFED